MISLGLISWSVVCDRKRFLTALVAQAVWDGVSSPTRIRRTDLERYADALDMMDRFIWR